jgi:hypothetical protein
MKSTNKLGIFLAVCLPIAVSATIAFAFPYGRSWMEPADSINNPGADQPAGRAGGGGLWGTGSKMDKGIKCSHCHIEPDGMIDASVTFSPPLDAGKYAPGVTYSITVDLLNEVHVQDATHPNTLNGFALTFETQSGTRAGVLRSDIAGVDSSTCPQNYPSTNPTNGTSYVYGNCNAITYVPAKNTTQWHAGWTAPAAGAGVVNMYYAVVDGDTPSSSSRDDDSKEGIVAIAEGP